MKKRLLPGLITLLAAQPALALDLMETYEKALSYDSGIASAMAQFQAQQATRSGQLERRRDCVTCL